MLGKIIRWSAAPISKNDHELSRSATLLNIVLWLLIGSSSLYAIFAPTDPEHFTARTIIIAPFVFLMLLLKHVLNLGYIRIVGVMIVICMWLIFTTAMLFGSNYNNPAYMGYVLVVITAGLVLNWRASIGWSIFCIVTYSTMIFLGQRGFIVQSTLDTLPSAYWTAQTAYILVAMALISQAIRKIDEAFENAQHEIRERKLVEAEREMFIKELESKNAELERFTYTVSHDLKSPLITISGYLGFLEKDAKLEQKEKFNNDVERIREATIKMQALLNDLLDLSRVGRLMNPPEEVNFEQIVQDAISIVDITLRKKNIKVTVQKDMPNVYVDRARLVEVMQNLLDNAAKFMGDQPAPHIEIGINTQNDTHVFFVKDNGIGIDTAHHERVFGLFNKLDVNSEGTGVGLALVKRTIEVHGGTIWLESHPGKGTTFYFTLPLNKNSQVHLTLT